jgi:hypothetical protein
MLVYQIGRSMMQRTLSSALAMIVLAIGVTKSSVLAQQPQRPPGKPVATIVDYDPPPTTLRGLLADVAAVVRGRVISSSAQRFDLKHGAAAPLTAHTFQIDEVFKRDLAAVSKGASIVTVIQHGGTITDPNGDVITGSLKDILQSGQEAILFLKEWPEAGGLTIAYGPAGTFLVKNGEVLIPGVVSSYPEFEGRRSISTATFVQLLRQLASTK